MHTMVIAQPTNYTHLSQTEKCKLQQGLLKEDDGTGNPKLYSLVNMVSLL